MAATRLTDFVASLPSTEQRWLTPAERHPLSIESGSRMEVAADLFQLNPEARFVAVVDDVGRPLGGLLERDIRQLLLNPYGHALLRNPAYGASLNDYIRTVPVVDAGIPVPDLIAAYREADGNEGMILTRGGRLYATLSNRRLVLLAAQHEVERARAQVEQAARIEASGIAFDREVGALAADLSALAATLRDHAAATGDRATSTGGRAAAMAETAARGARHLEEIEDEGRAPLTALAGVAEETRAAQALVSDAVAIVADGEAQTEALQRSAASIGDIARIIGDIASEVNMLALNAAIEAARAGEAGQGFAIVARAIKQLSGQAARAAETVAGHVGEARTAIDGVTAVHSRFGGVVRTLAERSARVMNAAEAQRTAMNAIATHVGEAAGGAQAIRAQAEGVGEQADFAARSAAAMRILADRLSRQTGKILSLANGFLSEVRGDGDARDAA